MLRLGLGFIACVILCGCSDFDETKIVDNYYLVDYYGELSLRYKMEATGSFVGVISDEIASYTTDGKVLLVETNGNLKSAKSLYYIVPIVPKISHFPDNNLVGPMELDEMILFVEGRYPESRSLNAEKWYLEPRLPKGE